MNHAPPGHAGPASAATGAAAAPAPSFDTLLHADWSVAAGKRWVAEARRSDRGWMVEAPEPVGDAAAFVERLFARGRVLAGFDFPIGVPAAYGRMAGLDGLPALLDALDRGDLPDFFKVAERPDQVSASRPFYPRVSTAVVRQRDLLDALGLAGIDTLRRRCERATSVRRAACPLFWTLGANQVGKAAITGWQEVLLPARRRGARLWPFDGSLTELALAELADPGLPVLAETYPGEAYGHVGIAFSPKMSKRRQDDRRVAMRDLPAWARRHGVWFEPALEASIADGFGAPDRGEDPFDALAGLLGMLEVVEGRRTAGPATARDPWEGWIMGQRAG